MVPQLITFQCYKCDGIENEDLTCEKENLNQEIKCEDKCSFILEETSETMFLHIQKTQVALVTPEKK